MWYVIDLFVMDFTITSHSCEFVKVDPPSVPTVIGLVGGLLYSMGVIGRRYIDVASLSATTESLSLF